MRPLSADEIIGVWASPLLPVGSDNKPDIDAVVPQIEIFARAGVDGVYTHGTAAEFHGQSEAEFRRFASLTAETCGRLSLPFQIGASHPFAPETLARIRFARGLAPGAVQVVLPDWAAPDLHTARRFLEGCAEAAEGVGLVLYNPPHAKKVLAAEELTALLRGLPGVVGLKCAGGGAGWYRQTAPLLDKISVFIPGHHMASGMAQGARGSYSNMACLNPFAAVRWLAMIKAAPDAADELETRIRAFMAETMEPLLAEGYPGYACDKLMAHLGVWTEISPRLLWPYSGVPETMAETVREAGMRLIPEFFEAPD